MPLRLNTKKRRVAVSLAAVAAVLLAGGLTMAFSGSSTPSGETYVDGNPGTVLYAPGHQALVPDFSGTTLTGTPLSFSAYRGKVVVVNFWGSWCDPCRSEGPTLAALSAKYSNDGVSFLGVDEQDMPVNAEAYDQKFGITYPSLNDPGGAVAQVVSSAILITSPPTTLVIDSTGHVAGAIFGTATYSVLNMMISKAATS